MNIVKLLMRGFDTIIGFLAICGAVIMAGVTLLVGTDVVMRYFFNHPIENVNEITEHCLVYITFLVAPWILKLDQHVRMEGVLGQFNLKNQLLINFITSILGSVICAILFISGFQGTYDYYQRGLWFPGGMRIPQYPILLALVVSYLLLFIQFLRRTYEYFRSWSKYKQNQGIP